MEYKMMLLCISVLNSVINLTESRKGSFEWVNMGFLFLDLQLKESSEQHHVLYLPVTNYETKTILIWYSNEHPLNLRTKIPTRRFLFELLSEFTESPFRLLEP